ncbi:hypothetical protein [Nonomuraea sp. WAC 01424]|uniref:hypothetical protein n=1 Tax=Nonomuraea sp. WAC 01424 TaxID=2203200 RepID=UPI00163CFC4F|nr:hypothetical protein [Nonomuraea sp. WAC 01424]
MHRRFALLPGTAAQAGAAPRPAWHAAADSTSEQRQVTRYWTEGRMESARPLDLPAPKSGGKAGRSSAAEPGEPGEPTAGTPWQAPPAVAAQLDGKSLVDVVGGQGVAFNQRRGSPATSGRPAT